MRRPPRDFDVPLFNLIMKAENKILKLQDESLPLMTSTAAGIDVAATSGAASSLPWCSADLPPHGSATTSATLSIRACPEAPIQQSQSVFLSGSSGDYIPLATAISSLTFKVSHFITK